MSMRGIRRIFSRVLWDEGQLGDSVYTEYEWYNPFALYFPKYRAWPTRKLSSHSTGRNWREPTEWLWRRQTASNVNTRNGNATVLPYKLGNEGKSWISSTFQTVDGDASVQNNCISSLNRGCVVRWPLPMRTTAHLVFLKTFRTWWTLRFPW